MIIFKYVRYKNFLSTGNSFTEIELNKNKITVIYGKNGTGKSTLLDAICYCLYNKAYRNINKPQLINSINNKQCLVEVEFSIGDINYLIRRGQKPNILQILQDGILINQLSDNRDYQGMLEQNILKMNEKTFRQTIILGSASFIPFMQLPAQHRREIIEDLLDLQVFSIMNNLLKEHITTNRDSIQEASRMIDMDSRLLEVARQHDSEMRESYENNIKIYIEKKEEHRKKNTDIEKSIEGYLEERNSIKSSPAIYGKYQDAIKLREKIDAKINATEKAILFLETHDSCPTCDQMLSHSVKHSRLLELQGKQQNYKNKRKELDVTIVKIEIKLERQKEAERKIQSIDASISESQSTYNSNKQIIESINNEVERIKNVLQHIQSSKAGTTQEILGRLNELNKNKEALLDEKELLNFISVLLKDGGIKAKVIKQYVSIINNTINHYLKLLNFNIQFELNESFEETITSRNRDIFSYDSFSEGEKMRIDLSILFAWRSIARMRNSSSSNLLILDEIFDSSLDYDGLDEFVEMMHKLTTGTNAIILSPKADALIDKFDASICFEKVKNFSRVKHTNI